MYLPDTLRSRLETTLGTTISAVKPCAGGDINEAVQINTTDGRYFVKWHGSAPTNMFEAEAYGLNKLAETDVLRVPRVVAYGEAENGSSAFLVLAWLESGQKTAATDVQLGEGLAALHQHTADQHGLDQSNFIGPLVQPNDWTESWPDFYGKQRIGAQMAIARQRGKLSAELANGLEKLIERLPRLLPDSQPSLMHGDLWRGNVMVLPGGRPAIIDPAVYYGHREVELAMTALFGGFSQAFYDAYQGVYPLEAGWRERQDLYQLYPLMVHMNLFGGGYTSQVQSIVRRYTA